MWVCTASLACASSNKAYAETMNLTGGGGGRKINRIVFVSLLFVVLVTMMFQDRRDKD